jgi:hypothetical protein|tara:strand:+ start:4147 stop:4584 length:438 start_codon:yes stop_codon:yes gene_type:complete
MNLEERGRKYFKALGINPDTKGRAYEEKLLDAVPVCEKGLKNEGCEISVYCFLFYTYVEVNMLTSEWTFQGSAGGVGIPGGMESAGDIYYDNIDTLLKATTFGLAFVAADGGIVQVTWGTSGNATAAAVGEGAGVFAGSGSWKMT